MSAGHDDTRTGWLRRNRLSLIAALVLIPLTVAVVGGQEWWLRFSSSAALAVETDAGTVVGGAEWQRVLLVDATRDVDAELPEGARMLVLHLRVAPEDGPVSCATPVLRERDGAGREWRPVRSSLSPDGIDALTECPDDSAAPFELVVPYLVPADAGALAVKVDVPELRPRFLLFAVDD